LHVLGLGGTVVEPQELERPLARLERTHLYADDRATYLVTVDYSAGFGSYNGPITFLLEVTAGRLNWLKATEEKTGGSERISLMQSPKTVWKIVPGARGSGRDILEAACRPELPDGSQPGEVAFRLSYVRYFSTVRSGSG
jgi:hypothetical protein